MDLNPAMLRKAAQGLYSSWSMRDAPVALREKYFLEEGRDFRVKPEIRSMVSFEARNLSQSNVELW